MTGARFEQTAMSYQPQPLAAIELIANTPVVMVAGRKAVCDGGQYCHWLADAEDGWDSG